ncbi:MAG TPA: hypothetical protein PLY70_04300 [Saprospiraceae bacterium]|nr:hypothetical protein [Saprospiraceae bacterium]HPN68777.1 hypothetical protein [Saprospiraceae bacterium]
MKIIYIFLAFFAINCLGQSTGPNPDDLYLNFVKAYDVLSAEKLANLYIKDAEALNLYDHSPSNSMKGRPSIEKYYERFFQAIKDENQKLRLTFKVVDRQKVGDLILDNGFYQLEVLPSAGSGQSSYGKFSTVLMVEDGVWKFKTDATTNTELVEYEGAVGEMIPKGE